MITNVILRHSKFQSHGSHPFPRSKGADHTDCEHFPYTTFMHKTGYRESLRVLSGANKQKIHDFDITVFAVNCRILLFLIKAGLCLIAFATWRYFSTIFSSELHVFLGTTGCLNKPVQIWLFSNILVRPWSSCHPFLQMKTRIHETSTLQLTANI